MESFSQELSHLQRRHLDVHRNAYFCWLKSRGPLTYEVNVTAACTTEAPAHTHRKGEDEAHQHASQMKKGNFRYHSYLREAVFYWENLEKRGTEQKKITELQLQKTLPPVLNSELAEVSIWQPAICQSDPSAGISIRKRLGKRANSFSFFLYRWREKHVKNCRKGKESKTIP